MLSTRFLRCLAFSLGILVLTGVVPAFGQEPYVYIATEEDWDNALTSGAIEPMSETEWDEYMAGWQTRGHGEPYPPNVFPRTSSIQPTQSLAQLPSITPTYPNHSASVILSAFSSIVQ